MIPLPARAGVDALTIAIQDGKTAGQTVPHVHVHILPRRERDFEPKDAVYQAMDAADTQEARSADDMASEAATLRALFAQSSL